MICKKTECKLYLECLQKKNEKPTTLAVGWIAGFKNLCLINLMF
jgi:hypothetical protein